MPRTPDQVAADEALTAAIEQARHAYWPPEEHGQPGAMMEYLVVGCAAIIGDDGTPFTRVFQLIREDGVPHHRLFGLLEYARVRLQSDMAAD